MATATTTKKFNWALLGAILTGLAGAAGTVLTPIYGTNLATNVQDILQAFSGLFAALGGGGAVVVAVGGAKALAVARATYRAQTEAGVKPS